MVDEIVLVMGFPASGKSTIVKELADRGYYRINRDSTGGKLDGQAKLAHDAYQGGAHQIVLDNTYITAESRKSIIEVAKNLKIPIRCIWLTTGIEDCQLNACLRMMGKYGRVLSPDELKKSKDPNAFPITALFAARKKFESPTTAEGFTTVEEREFTRTWGREYCNKAVILDFDGTLRESTGPQVWPEKPGHVQILPGRSTRLQKAKKDGYLLLGASNQSAIAKGLLETDCILCFEQTIKLLEVMIEYQYCPHKIPPFSCYCRKPAPGMAAYFIHKHKLRPADCIMVGDATSDKTFAERAGFKYQTPQAFFGS